MSSTLAKNSNLKHLVFTYGTLKRGEPNCGVLKPQKHTFVGSGQTTRKHPLVVATRHNIPCLLDLEGTGFKVSGEVYLVDDEMLMELDDFEESPDVYQRIETDIEMTEIDDNHKYMAIDGHLKCWTYKIKNFRQALLTRTFLSNYASSEQKSYTELDDKFETDDYWTDVVNGS